MPPSGGFFSPFSAFRHSDFIANCMKNHKQVMEFQAEIAKDFTTAIMKEKPYST